MFSTEKSLAKFTHTKPSMGFQSQVLRSVSRPKPESALRKVGTHSTCREEVIWNTRAKLAGLAYNWVKTGGAWGNKQGFKTATLDLDDPQTKQPEATYMYIGCLPSKDRGKEINRGRLIQLLDATVGCIGVITNPDRYEGDWWTTSVAESKRQKGLSGVRWYGCDNSMLRHPVLVSMYLGLFRQVCLLEAQGFGPQMISKIKRAGVVEALTNADPDQAFQILGQMRPWIELGSSYLAPFPKGHWPRIEKLYKAFLKHDHNAVFGASFEESWSFPAAGTYQRHGSGVPTGMVSYWGPGGKETTPAGKRLAELSR